MTISLAFYYKTIISKDGIKGFTLLGKAHCIEWINIIKIDKRRFFLIDTISIEGNGKKIYVGLLGNFEWFRTCAEKFDKDCKLTSYLNGLTLEEVKSIKNSNNVIALIGIIALFMLLNISAYEHFIWYPAKLVGKVKTLLGY